MLASGCSSVAWFAPPQVAGNIACKEALKALICLLGCPALGLPPCAACCRKLVVWLSGHVRVSQECSWPGRRQLCFHLCFILQPFRSLCGPVRPWGMGKQKKNHQFLCSTLPGMECEQDLAAEAFAGHWRAG